MTPRRPHLLRDGLVLFWATAAIVLTGVHPWVPASSWLMIHLVLLGALTHAAFVWSEHFTHTLLRTTPRPGDERLANVRQVVLAAGSLLVFVGVPWERWPLVLAGAVVVATVVLWHAAHLVRATRRALPGRFRIVIRYYVAAAACLPVGAGFGAALAWGPGDEWRGRLLAAHALVNLLGWIGLTVTGTLVTFWPTLLRTRMDDRAERLARQALPVLGAGLAVAAAGSLAGVRWLAAAGLVGYLAGVVHWGRALVLPARTKPPREFAAASVGAAVAWGVAGQVWLAVILVTTDSWPAVTDAMPLVAGVLAVGFAVQLLTGALSFLLPSVLGGGPAAVRSSRRWFNRGTTLRLVVINAGLLLWLLPAPSWVRVGVSSLVLVALAAFVPLAIGGVRASLRARRDPDPASAPADEPSVWSAGQLIAALTALVVTVSVGVAVDPAAAGLTGGAAAPASAVAPTGRTVRVEVAAVDMRFVPDSVTVERGDRLVVEFTNTDPTTAHDLLIGAARTPRLQPGASVELDAGVIGASTRGWCTVAGHRQLGMVFDVLVEEGSDAAPPAAPSAAPAAAPASGHGGHAEPASGAATPASAVDPVLPPVDDARVRKVTLTVQEVPLEVAPGVWQRRWTFNGVAPGPTLHGRVGDVFEVTLVNDGSIGHSIDFHAGALAPDRPMRTIPPGESLVYRFTATRAGIWMYHCATMPMSAHIAAGMHGAVVIEPADLPAVDRSYVLVQSEVHLGTAAATAAASDEVDVDSVLAETPDRVVFNGVANQYDAHPFAARVGERVRFWVLDAGPNRATSFHIVGGQFDTVYAEGVYLLREGRGRLGETDAGSQALALQPAQGGFVELVFPEAGHYPVVSHVMVDAERGAHGIVAVTP